MKDYALQSAPTLTYETFVAALTHRNSPALPEAQNCWDVFVAWGMNPAVGLAMFVAESSAGSDPGWYGTNHPIKNWGDLRASPEEMSNDGQFAYYPTYAQSVNALCWTLVRGKLYLPELDTVSKMATRWAPSSDGNNPKHYASLINELCAEWEAMGG